MAIVPYTLNAYGAQEVQVAPHVFGTDGLSVMYEVGPPDDRTNKAVYPSVRLTTEEGSEAWDVSVGASFTDDIGLDYTMDATVVAAATPVTFTFTDKCGELVTDEIVVNAELNNGTFGGSSSAVFTTTTGSVTFTVDTDGVSDLNSSGMFLEVYPAGDRDNEVFIIPLRD
ncbi:MAG: hypothetical protein VW258_08840 [Thalassolituus sp.]